MDSKLDVPHSQRQDESDVSEDYDVPPPAYRRNSESSTERSLYDEKDQALFAGGPASSASHVREYGWYHPKVLTRGLVITDAAASTPTSKAPLYYVEVSEFALKKPDVILHALPPTMGTTNDLEHLANTGESAPMAGVAHFPKFSRHIKVGLGDPSSGTEAMTYVEVRNANLVTHGEYHMSLDGRSYAWKRTHAASAGVEGGSATRMMHWESFQLVDMGTNEVVAVFLDNKFKSWKKKGKLRIFRDFETARADQPEETQRLKLLIFVSIAAILEKARRRANRRRNNGGGGGGGGP
ncbi:uncharacterized protein PV07_00136 [Cladophialophora immunda]|uniref:Uncharacterized protein n=1 Tax=Cladophialophora immunda TaxID=569365 RepID=A0A0D1ZYS2_9EURO|nr:uncharacterized protein PV07_00136 [Cladophialophora immunda]KIW33276.1 hypothetical protein PV07_00136 [Cladophialophora immunda]OQV10837.1 hypothetical protein CLAIMM_14763 [Cladophialophora immunda]